MKARITIIFILLSLNCCSFFSEKVSNSYEDRLSYFFSNFSNKINNWTMFDIEGNKVNLPKRDKEYQAKILQVNIQVFSQEDELKDLGSFLLWYGAPSNSSSEHPLNYAPKQIVNLINIAKLNQSYYIYPPSFSGVGSKVSWRLSPYPLAENIASDKRNKFIFNKKKNKYFLIKKTDVYNINNFKSKVIRSEVIKKGIFGKVFEGNIHFSKKIGYREIIIHSFSKKDNKEYFFTSGKCQIYSKPN